MSQFIKYESEQTLWKSMVKPTMLSNFDIKTKLRKLKQKNKK